MREREKERKREREREREITKVETYSVNIWMNKSDMIITSNNITKSR